MQKTPGSPGVFASVAYAAYFFLGAAFLAAFLGAAFLAVAFLAAFLGAAFFVAFLAAAFLAAATVRFAGRALPLLPMVRLPFLVFLSPFPIVWSVKDLNQIYSRCLTDGFRDRFQFSTFECSEPFVPSPFKDRSSRCLHVAATTSIRVGQVWIIVAAMTIMRRYACSVSHRVPADQARCITAKHPCAGALPGDVRCAPSSGPTPVSRPAIVPPVGAKALRSRATVPSLYTR